MSTNTIKLYDEDSYLSDFSATVISCTAKQIDHQKPLYEVILSATAFFPEGGGQASDTGILNGIPVIDVQEKNEIIYHTLTAPLTEGEVINGSVNQTRRFDFMQQHTGEHILSGLVFKNFGYDNVGFHLGTDTVTVDFSGTFTEEDIRRIEELANDAVFHNIPVVAVYPDKVTLKSLNYRSKKELSGAIRIVTIKGVDTCACCAPHVKFTGEVGLIKVTSYQNYKGGTRLELQCGKRALTDYNKKEKNIQNISVTLSAKIYETDEAVKRLKDEKLSLEAKLTNLTIRLLNLKADSIPSGEEPYILFDYEIPDNQLRHFANLVKERRNGVVGIFIPSAKDSLIMETDEPLEYRYVMCAKAMDVRPMGAELNKSFLGRGGGSKEMVQGSITGRRTDIADFLKNFTF
ncbi:alanyl-tRNA editing protein [Anaerocolumna sp. AGMB13020]|uniref:alanyl-tRNA editing protein n=1 Tax=Anaerocolumna sp. AGMB13020 TaxID=3081750 RepID=UPI002954071F|nr:alanyl-tRNA editing protein [Anaerocolumna sp. AGMB13020]WOO36987.1 alanyl-tRNA editing protein [Anaerocolumna sp. AGMB13020]